MRADFFDSVNEFPLSNFDKLVERAVFLLPAQLSCLLKNDGVRPIHIDGDNFPIHIAIFRAGIIGPRGHFSKPALTGRLILVDERIQLFGCAVYGVGHFEPHSAVCILQSIVNTPQSSSHAHGPKEAGI